ncbi:MAG: hypothetical protein ACKVJP_01850 [Flavobacteriales bacterium]|jgi:hypothetical protein|tara:strand:+ start:292 stop:513 length:222 start_codon:yes stop_codon:yes gene_type:complete
MNYPVYRKYFNGMSYFKIISKMEFEEKQKIGSKIHKHHVIANQFPEKIRIKDMVECFDNLWSEIEKEEFDNFI